MRSAVIGLPACVNDSEHRFALSPEGASRIVDRGFRLKMETGAAEHIHYHDDAYARVGVEIVSRREAFDTDIVVYLPAVSILDVHMMGRGTMLLTLQHDEDEALPGLLELLKRHIITIALDRVRDNHGRRPFADIIDEIGGRAAIAIASSLLADAIHGKGILIGGIPGVVPCEVTILGADIAGCAAASAAIGLGAMVRLFDSDIYRLQCAAQKIGPGAICSAPHPKVLVSALRSADIVIATDAAGDIVIDAGVVEHMKGGVITFDLGEDPSRVFPSMPLVNLDLASPYDTNPATPVRLCYVNASNAVPRTTAMAMSNALVNMTDDIFSCDGLCNTLRLNAGIRAGAITFLGKCVDSDLARRLNIRSFDIDLLSQSL